MKDQDLKNTVNNIRLPEESRERIIRNLEQINPDESVFDVEPAKMPILRDMMIALAACVVVTVTAVGIHISSRENFSPASEVIQETMPPEQTAPFGDISQMELRLMFVQYAPAYIIPTDEQKYQLAKLLNSFSYENRVDKNDFDGEFFTLYLDDNGERKEITCYCIGYIAWEEENVRYICEAEELVHEIKELFIPADVVYQMNESDDMFDTPKEEIKFDYSSDDLSEHTAPFGDVSQMELRLTFREYEMSYIIPTDEQKSQLADLLNHFNYENRVNRNHSYGDSFSLWLNDNGEQKEIKLLEDGYIAWKKGSAMYIYEAEELISEIKNLFIPADVVYQKNASGDLFDTPEKIIEIDYSSHDLSEYWTALEEYNQEHPDYQFQIAENVLNGDPYAVTMFLNEYPTLEAFRQKLLESHEVYESEKLPKEEIYYRCLNTLEFLDQLSGKISIYGSGTFEGAAFESMTEGSFEFDFVADQYHAIVEEKFTGEVDIPQIKVEHFNDAGHSFTLYDYMGAKPNGYTEELHGSSMKGIIWSDQDNIYNTYGQDPTNAHELGVCFIPQEMSIGYLENFENWEVVEIMFWNGRVRYHIQGTSEEYGSRFDVSTFHIWVDKETGIWYEYEGYNEAGELTDYFYTENIQFGDEAEQVKAFSDEMTEGYELLTVIN